MLTDAAPRKKSRELFCRSDGMKDLVLLGDVTYNPSSVLEICTLPTSAD